jgi:membrane-associated protease RseP (regulator of RpoE activity)
MSIEESLLILSGLIIAYTVFVIFLNKKGYFEKYNISFYGPALLLRTSKGVGFLQKIAQKKRFWKAFGNFGIVFCFIMMIFMVLLIALNMWAVLGFTPEQQESLPGLEFGLVIPGLNPLLPLEYIFYILVALIVAVIVHEFSHGILTFAQNLKVKSLGILYLIIPLGAFCEPDEDQIRETGLKKRMRVYAAGPMSNFTIAFIMLILFSSVFMASVQPIDGVHVLYTVEDSPAEKLGFHEGVIITSMNNSDIANINDFYNVMDNTSINQTIAIKYLDNNILNTETVTLASKYTYTNLSEHKNTSFLGIVDNPYLHGFLFSLQRPFTFNFPNGLIILYSLPFLSYLIGYNPIVAPYTSGYTINGPLGMIPSDAFWPIVNLLYWVFWLNLVVAFFNVLPMIPLDGGFLFSDALRGIIQKFKKNINEEQQEKLVKNITLVLSLLILIIVLSPWLVKYF